VACVGYEEEVTDAAQDASRYGSRAASGEG
jgi:hypothetical protein